MYASSPRDVTLGSITRGLLRSALDFFLPAPCLACGETVREPRRSLGLCAPCRGQLARWSHDACDGCGRALSAAQLPAGYLCGACRRRSPPYERLLSAWSYQPPLDAVLTGLKFRRLEYLGSQLGREVAELLRPELEDCDLVVPVPLHWRRYLRRGYNQAAVIARALAADLGLPLAGVLRRRRATPAQSRLSRAERRRNLRDAFSLRPEVFAAVTLTLRSRKAVCAGQSVLLVDDVATTCTTLRTAAACLRRAGAKSVTALAVARTPE